MSTSERARQIVYHSADLSSKIRDAVTAFRLEISVKHALDQEFINDCTVLAASKIIHDIGKNLPLDQRQSLADTVWASIAGE